MGGQKEEMERGRNWKGKSYVVPSHIIGADMSSLPSIPLSAPMFARIQVIFAHRVT